MDWYDKIEYFANVRQPTFRKLVRTEKKKYLDAKGETNQMKIEQGETMKNAYFCLLYKSPFQKHSGPDALVVKFCNSMVNQLV